MPLTTARAMRTGMSVANERFVFLLGTGTTENMCIFVFAGCYICGEVEEGTIACDARLYVMGSSIITPDMCESVAKGVPTAEIKVTYHRACALGQAGEADATELTGERMKKCQNVVDRCRERIGLTGITQIADLRPLRSLIVPPHSTRGIAPAAP